MPAMIHGFKPGTPSAAAPWFVPWWRAVLLAAGIFVLVALVLDIR